MGTPFFTQKNWMLWAAAVISAGLLELPFPLAGPMPPWRSIFAWFGLEGRSHCARRFCLGT
jgi:hypothetical protein